MLQCTNKAYLSSLKGFLGKNPQKKDILKEDYFYNSLILIIKMQVNKF